MMMFKGRQKGGDFRKHTKITKNKAARIFILFFMFRGLMIDLRFMVLANGVVNSEVSDWL